MNSQKWQDIALLNTAIIFISTTGALGRYIDLFPKVAIFWKASLAAILLLGVCLFQGINLFKEIYKDWLIFAFAGA